MKKKITRKAGTPTALGHDPLAWIDADEATPERDESEISSVTEIEEEPREAVETEQVAVAVEEEVNDVIEEESEPEIQPEENSVEEANEVNETDEVIEVDSENMGKAQDDDGHHTLVLEEMLGIAQVDQFYQTLLTTMNQASFISIDATALQQIDAAGVQLMYVFIQDAKKHSIEVRWESSSEALEKTARQLGMLEHLGL